MFNRYLRNATLILLVLTTNMIYADDLLHRYEGDVLPYDESAGWFNGGCEPPCFESLQDGHFVLHWTEIGDSAGYLKTVTDINGEPPPPDSFWVEWQFRSNHPIGANFYTCDANFRIVYLSIFESLLMYGDAVLSPSGNFSVFGLNINDFHTYRFESNDAINFRFSVDGYVFWSGSDNKQFKTVDLAMIGRGGCLGDWFPGMVNEWDFVRYGTITFGEQIIATNPRSGYLNPNSIPSLDRFTVTFDQPNYAYTHDITVEVSGGDAPIVIQTRRLDNGNPEVLEIVLDKPIPSDEATRFIFNDGETTNVVGYSYILGDSDADGLPTLRDFAAFQNCFDPSASSNNCAAFDFDNSSLIDLKDYSEFNLILTGP